MKAGHKVLDIPRGAGGTLSDHLALTLNNPSANKAKPFISASPPCARA